MPALPLDPTLPLKDALRTLRFTLRRGREMLDLTDPPVPAPISEAARAALTEVDRAVTDFDRVAGGLGHRLLDPPTAETLDQIASLEDAEAAFAAAAYRALMQALASLGARDVLVSEVRLADAYRAALAAEDRGAALLDEMRTRRAVAEAAPDAAGDVACLAVVLWFLAERDGPEPGLLADCCAMAQALAPDLAAATDRAALAQLLSQYADKI